MVINNGNKENVIAMPELINALTSKQVLSVIKDKLKAYNNTLSNTS